jgi:hypothetical protein
LLSASARISKGQGYQLRLLKEKGREQFWPKRTICVVQGKTLKMRKTDRISILLGPIRCFFISFNTLDGSLMELVS